MAKTAGLPAVLSAPSEATLPVLTSAVSQALNGRSVLLGADSLTTRSTLIIERKIHIGPDGHPIMGRSTEKPDHFQLLKRGDLCYLRHEETGNEQVLENVKCGVEDKG